MDITGFIKRYPVWAFLAIAFIYTWALMSVLVVSTPPGGMEAGISPSFFFLAVLGGIGPSLAGIIVTRVVDGKGSIRALLARLGQWRVNIGWYAVALLMIPLLSIAALAIEAAMGMPVPTIDDIASNVALGIIWPIFAALGEEFGWRGFALPKLQSRHTALVSSLIIGVAWGMWHLPMDFIGMGHYGVLFIPNFIVISIQVIALAILMTWVYNNTKGSMLLAVLFHASITASAIIFSSLTLSAMDSLRHQLVYTALLWVIVAIVVTGTGARRLVREPRNRRPNSAWR